MDIAQMMEGSGGIKLTCLAMAVQVCAGRGDPKASLPGAQAQRVIAMAEEFKTWLERQ